MKRAAIALFFIAIAFLVGCENTTPASCPNIEMPEKFFPVKGNEIYTLDASGITIADDYEIAPSEKQVNPFTTYSEVVCHKGKEAGENINNIYCDQLMIVKRITNDAGDILEESILGVRFVFDNTQKLVETKCYS